ncbi:MAG: zf-HC2 domain-containing protein [Thermoanaerobaculaceae bacterium]
MTSCDEARRWLDDRLDGELAGSLGEGVDAHLAACSDCRAYADGVRSLLAAAAELPREIQPERDLWPDVAARVASPTTLGHSSRHPAVRWGALAAAAVVLVGLTAVITARLVRPGAGPAGVGLRAGGGVSVAPASLAGLGGAFAEYERAAQALRAALADRRGQISPATLRDVEDNLRIIDGAIASLRAALAESPDNPELSTLLAATYRQQIDLLKTANKLASI